MTATPLSIDGSFLFEHRVFLDDRGFFREWFRTEDLNTAGIEFRIAQANLSRSKRGVIRGLHFSVATAGQSKLMTCTDGEVEDVLVDFRIGSPTFLQSESISLSADSGKGIYVPTGVGHGFCARSESATVVYLTSSNYSPEFEKSVHPLDVELALNWRLPEGIVASLSAADQAAPTLDQALTLGIFPKLSKIRGR
jgi:dTDP-4-dehydrorhamnose 3,5-epimerase